MPALANGAFLLYETVAPLPVAQNEGVVPEQIGSAEEKK
jgi:hypothetical protein